MKIIASQKLAAMTDNVKENDILVIDNEVMTEQGEEVHFIQTADWSIDTHVSVWNNGVICHGNNCDCQCCYGYSSVENLVSEGQDIFGFYLEVEQGIEGLVEKSIYGQETLRSEIYDINMPLDEVSDVLEEELSQIDIETDDIIKALNQCELIEELQVA